MTSYFSLFKTKHNTPQDDDVSRESTARVEAMKSVTIRIALRFHPLRRVVGHSAPHVGLNVLGFACGR
jgi:hypothetical protein